MSPHLASLRVDCDAIRKGGYQIDGGAPMRPDHKTHGGFTYKTAQDELRCPRAWNMENVTEAVTEYLASDRAHGRLKEIAIKHHTTPGSILGRINRGKYRRGLTIKQHMEGADADLAVKALMK